MNLERLQVLSDQGDWDARKQMYLLQMRQGLLGPEVGQMMSQMLDSGVLMMREVAEKIFESMVENRNSNPEFWLPFEKVTEALATVVIPPHVSGRPRSNLFWGTQPQNPTGGGSQYVLAYRIGDQITVGFCSWVSHSNLTPYKMGKCFEGVSPGFWAWRGEVETWPLVERLMERWAKDVKSPRIRAHQGLYEEGFPGRKVRFRILTE
jgi:hypothetical protein